MAALSAVEHWRRALRRQLTAAMRDRRPTVVSALRSTLAAIDNAEAADPGDRPAPETGRIAGGVVGVGAAEVERRVLSDDDIEHLLRLEIAERRAAAADYQRGGHSARAETALEEALVIEDLLRRGVS